MKEVEFINLHLQLSDEDVKRIDEWKIKFGMRSRSEAIRHIIREFSEVKKSILSERAPSIIENFEQSEKIKKDSIEEMIKKMVEKEINKKLKK